MPYQGVNQRTIQQMQRVGKGFIDRYFRNRQTEMEQQRMRQEREGVANVYKSYVATLSGEDDEKSRIDNVLKTIGALQQYPNYGKDAVNQIIQAEGLRSKYKEARPKTIEEALVNQEIDPTKATEMKTALGKNEKHTEFDAITGSDNNRYSRLMDPGTSEAYWLWPDGTKSKTLPPGVTVKESSSGDGADKTLKKQLNNLLAEKRGLEKKILSRKDAKNINLDAILRGEQGVPEVNEVVLRQVQNELGDKSWEKVETGNRIPDKDIAKWLELIGRTEELMSQTGEEFTPADQIADEKKEKKSAGKRTIPGF